jgi:hypothetical protein
MTTKPMKILQRKYSLVNVLTREKLTVFPPRVPGINKDFNNPKDSDGQWIRVFKVVEGPRTGEEIVLRHLPGEAPSCVIDGIPWVLEAL